MRMFFCGLLLALMPVGLGMAQGNKPVVNARALTANDSVHANSTLKVAIVAEVAPGYHINDHKPTLDYLIPTELRLEPNAQMALRDVTYPRGTLRKLTFSDASLSVYEGEIVVGALLQVAKAVRPGSYTLKGKLAYQACNDHACLPPTSVPLTLTVKVVPRSVPLKQVNSDVFQRIQFKP
jgi:thioredoxin:protein disulfide reductase